MSLTEDECIALLSARTVGRIAVVHEGYPAVFPVNYVMVRAEEGFMIAIRTRPTNVIDRVDELVAFQIDSTEVSRDRGWSVLVRGRLLAVTPDEVYDSHPILDGRDAWRIVIPHVVTGRKVDPPSSDWDYDAAAYL